MYIRKATIDDLEKLLILFNQYRDFYKKEYDEDNAREFLRESLLESKSVIFIALKDENSTETMGFARLVVSYCSLDLSKYWILYDLYTDVNCRSQGVATALLNTVKTFASESNASRVDLQTAHTNHTAQKLYEQNGYSRDNEFYTYSLELPRKASECNPIQEESMRHSIIRK